MKLEKLCYYSQAWTLATTNESLFDEDFRAWASGPVCMELFQLHKDTFVLHDKDLGEYNPEALSDDQREKIDVVLADYFECEPYELCDEVHQERPWIKARVGLRPGDECETVISKESMRRYYVGYFPRPDEPERSEERDLRNSEEQSAEESEEQNSEKSEGQNIDESEEQNFEKSEDETRTSVIDVAKYILHKNSRCTTMKLERLCYYSQAWTLATTNEPLFPEDFRAWASGPVCMELFQLHKDTFVLHDKDLGEYNPEALSDEQREKIDVVLEDYWEWEPYELCEEVHQEKPWIEARVGLLPGDECETVISKESMRTYYVGYFPRPDEDDTPEESEKHEEGEKPEES
jgi:uncharacterized phage-associated protein